MHGAVDDEIERHPHPSGWSNSSLSSSFSLLDDVIQASNRNQVDRTSSIVPQLDDISAFVDRQPQCVRQLAFANAVFIDAELDERQRLGVGDPTEEPCFERNG